MDTIPSENQDKMICAEAVDFRFLAENCADILSIVGLDYVIRYMSPICADTLSWKPEEMIGRKFSDFIFAKDLFTLDESAAASREKGMANFQATVRLRKKGRNYVWINIHGRCAHDPAAGAESAYVLSMRDISDRKALERKLSAQAMTDALTGLGNRRAFDQALRRGWRRTVRDQTKLSLVLLDLDNFKPLNDRHGHSVGDKCLLEIAMAISNAVRAADLVCRWGGDEIAIILPDTDEAGAAIVAEKVRAAVEEVNLQVQENSSECVSVTASIGVATAMPPTEKSVVSEPHYLLQAADNALYRAKHEGQNRVVTVLLAGPQAELAEDRLRHFVLDSNIN